MRVTSIDFSPAFKRELKRLSKRYRSLESDLEQFIQSLIENPTQGVDLGNGLRKVRLAISSKNKGKSGGARVITYTLLLEQEGKLVLLTIYDKSERETISLQELDDALAQLG